MMDLIEFPEQTVVIAKDQPQYRKLPAYQYFDAEGRIACCWQLSLYERLVLLFTGKLWHQVLTFNQPLQPQLLTVTKPEMPGAVMHRAYGQIQQGREREAKAKSEAAP